MLTTQGLTTTRCWCGLPHSIPDALYKAAQESHKEVYCPLGHTWVIKDSPLKKLEQENQQLKLSLQQKDNQLADERHAKERLEKRARRGVCAFCKRSFGNMRAHMLSKHSHAKK